MPPLIAPQKTNSLLQTQALQPHRCLFNQRQHIAQNAQEQTCSTTLVSPHALGPPLSLYLSLFTYLDNLQAFELYVVVGLLYPLEKVGG